MKSIHVRDVTPVTIAAIKRLARAHKRSMQGELREILERAARQAPPEEGDKEFRLITVKTERKSTWDREEIYGESGR
jgi:plasmid stability protein